MLLLLPDDSELNSLLMAVTVDVTVFVACLVVYVVRTRHVADGPETQSLIGVSPKFSTTSSTTTATSARFYPFPVATILRQFPDPRPYFFTSKFSWVVIRFLQLCLAVLAVMTTIGMTILVPVYLSGGNIDKWEAMSALGRASIANVNETGLMVSAFGVALVFIVLVCSVASGFLDESERLQKDTTAPDSVQAVTTDRDVPAMPRTIHISEIPRVGFTESQLREYLEARFPGRQIDQVHVVPDLSEAALLAEQLDQLTQALERARICRSQRNPTSVARAAQLENEHRQLTRQVALAVSTALTRHSVNSGHAFVAFRTRQQARAALAYLRGPARKDPHGQAVGLPGWVVMPAPPCEDIIWDNVAVSASVRWFRCWIGNAFLAIMMVIIITPSTVLTPLTYILTGVDSVRGSSLADSTGASLVGSAMPALALFLVNTIILPWLIQLMADFQREFLVTERERSIMSKHTLFLFFNALLLPTFSLNSLASFINSEYVQDLSFWQQQLGLLIMSSGGQFFMIYLVHAALLGPAAELLDVSGMFWRAYYRYTAVTRAELDRSKQQTRIDCGYSLAYHLTMFGLALTYSVTVPLLLPFALMYFVINVAVMRHLIDRRLRTVDGDALNNIVPSLVLYMYSYVVIFELVIASIMGIQKAFPLRVCAVVMVVGAIVTILTYGVSQWAAATKPSLHAVTSSGHEQGFASAYMHPLLQWERNHHDCDL
ncbi:CSC1/OSCA1-like 7TM region domain-containing protein [Plasmodiophora brassicae]